MRWEKRGRVYVPDGSQWWARTHAFMPTADVREDGRIRVYFAGLDEAKFGRIGYVDLDAADPSRVLGRSAEPVLDLGPLGTFDDSGVNPSCVLDRNGRKYLYYIGWQRAERVPYMLFAGLATGDSAGDSFQRAAPVPVLDRTRLEPYSRSAPFVCWEDGRFKAWYWSCVEWTRDGDWTHYNNVVRYAESPDGLDWTAAEEVCIAPEADDYSIGRPWVVRDADRYRMWYSIRSRTRPYRIGYAESHDGLRWTRRDDEVGIGASPQGWDSEMVCFPCVVDAGGRRLMFYNGNRHGETGFGYAELVEEPG